VARNGGGLLIPVQQSRQRAQFGGVGFRWRRPAKLRSRAADPAWWWPAQSLFCKLEMTSGRLLFCEVWRWHHGLTLQF
jgi:hypothetical protein